MSSEFTPQEIQELITSFNKKYEPLKVMDARLNQIAQTAMQLESEMGKLKMERMDVLRDMKIDAHKIFAIIAAHVGMPIVSNNPLGGQQDFDYVDIERVASILKGMKA